MSEPKASTETREGKVKVFSMNDCDWMAGLDLESCIEEYLREFAGGLPYDEVIDSPGELTSEQMTRMQFHDNDGTDRSFQEQLNKLVAEGETFPQFFASTEY